MLRTSFNWHGLNFWLLSSALGLNLLLIFFLLVVAVLYQLLIPAGDLDLFSLGLLLGAFLGPLAIGFLTGKLAGDGRGPSYGLAGGLLSGLLLGLLICLANPAMSLIFAITPCLGGLNGGYLTLHRITE